MKMKVEEKKSCDVAKEVEEKRNSDVAMMEVDVHTFWSDDEKKKRKRRKVCMCM
jgi:hypothetical protein